MTNDERINELEAEFAVLKQQIAHERSERIALQAIVFEAQGKLRQDVETAELSKQWFDQCFADLSTAVSEGASAAEVMAALVKLIEGIFTQQARMVDWFDKLLTRVKDVENAVLIRR